MAQYSDMGCKFPTNPKREALEAAAYEAGFAWGLSGNKACPITCLVKGISIRPRRDCAGAGVDFRIGCKAGYATFLDVSKLGG